MRSIPGQPRLLNCAWSDMRSMSGHRPEDIELTVEKAHGALRPGCGAAFSVDIEEEERLVIVQEVKRQYRKANLEEVIFAIRQAVAEEHGLQVHAVVLVRAGSVPKTSSGKIQRHACRSRFLEKRLDVLRDEAIDESSSEFKGNLLSRETIMAWDASSRQSQLELYLLQEAAHVLKVHPGRLNPKRSLSSLGIDSLMAVQLASQLEVNLQVTVPMAKILGAATFAELASFVLNQIVNGVADDVTAGNSGGDQQQSQSYQASNRLVPHLAKTGADANIFPVTWQQESLWLQHQTKGAGSQTLNILLAIRLKGCLHVGALEQSLNAIVSRHAILRTTYTLWFSSSDKQSI